MTFQRTYFARIDELEVLLGLKPVERRTWAARAATRIGQTLSALL
jgi:hypothetical protein